MTETINATTEVLWARFRFSVVGALLSSPPARGELSAAIESLADKTWTHPVTGRDVQYAASTVERWYYKARNEQDDPLRVLQRAVRRDHGKISLGFKLAEHLRGQYRDHSHWSYQLHYNNLASAVKADPSLAPLRSYSTVRRFMQTRGMVRKRRLQPNEPRKEIARRELIVWLFEIILSRTTPANVRNELKIENLDRITQVARDGSVDLRKRALAILARSKGFSEALVAECLNMSTATVSRTISEFRHSDDPLQALRRRPRKRDNNGRRRMTNSLLEILHHNPGAYGVNRSSWTCQSLADVYEKQHQHRISSSTVGRCLKQAGYRRKKSRQVLTSPDPEYREKVELVLATLHSLKADEMFFFIDELGPLQVKRYGGRCYTPKNRTPTHPQRQHSKGSIIFHAALSATTNQMTWVYGNAKDTYGMIDLVELLFNEHHARARLYITWDAASWHSSNLLMDWVDELNAGSCARRNGPMIEFVPLPTNSQFLNVIETVFGTMKKTVIHGSNYRSEEEMKTAISRHFRERNEFFRQNPKRAGKKIWEINFFEDPNNIRGGNYREW